MPKKKAKRVPNGGAANDDVSEITAEGKADCDSAPDAPLDSDGTAAAYDPFSDPDYEPFAAVGARDCAFVPDPSSCIVASSTEGEGGAPRLEEDAPFTPAAVPAGELGQNLTAQVVHDPETPLDVSMIASPTAATSVPDSALPETSPLARTIASPDQHDKLDVDADADSPRASNGVGDAEVGVGEAHSEPTFQASVKVALSLSSIGVGEEIELSFGDVSFAKVPESTSECVPEGSEEGMCPCTGLQEEEVGSRSGGGILQDANASDAAACPLCDVMSNPSTHVCDSLAAGVSGVDAGLAGLSSSGAGATTLMSGSPLKSPTARVLPQAPMPTPATAGVMASLMPPNHRDGTQSMRNELEMDSTTPFKIAESPVVARMGTDGLEGSSECVTPAPLDNSNVFTSDATGDKSHLDPRNRADRTIALEVCRGELKRHAMWQRLQRLKGIPTSVGLNLLPHADDVAGQEAAGREVGRKHGKVYEQDSGRARMVRAIAAAETGDVSLLMQCRGRGDKMLALDSVVRFTNQGLILHVIMWLRETMKHDHFIHHLALRPTAVGVYVNYLKDTQRWDELERFLVEVRRVEVARCGQNKATQRNDTLTELALCKIRRVMQADEPSAQLSALKDAHSFISGVPSHMMWESSGLEQMGPMCKEWQELLVRQVEIERKDLNLSLLQANGVGSRDLKNIASDGNVSIWSRFPRASIIGEGVLAMLQYLALYHGGEDESSVASPKGLRRAIPSISEKMFWFAALTSLARRGSWDTIKTLTEANSILSSKTKLHSPIGWRPLINLIFDFGDPEPIEGDPLRAHPALLAFAVQCAGQMQNRVEAYHLCVNKELWDAALQCCVDAKDEDLLMDLRLAVSQSQSSHKAKLLQKIDEVYGDNRVKWRSELQKQGTPKTLLGSASDAMGLMRSATSSVGKKMLSPLRGFPGFGSVKKEKGSSGSNGAAKQQSMKDLPSSKQLFGSRGLVEDE